jgi:hypothetical protein
MSLAELIPMLVITVLVLGAVVTSIWTKRGGAPFIVAAMVCFVGYSVYVLFTIH